MYKKKVKEKRVKKYIISFCIVIILMIVLLLMEKTIPNEKSRQNILKSEKYYHDYFDYQFSNINILKHKHEAVDVTADLYHLSMIYMEDNKHPWKSFIEMNKDSKISEQMINKESFRNIKIDSDYSRYWNGQLIILKPLLSFFTMTTIYNIYMIVFGMLYFILLFLLFKHSKIFAIIFTLSSIIINLFFVTTCDNLIHVFSIGIISSIILIKMYEKQSKNIDLLFLIVGMLTVYFDHITCETITLTLPLIIYVFLNYKDYKKLDYRKVIKYIFLWFVGYCLTFITKWILLTIHYHGHFIEKVIEPMTIRIYYENKSILSVFFNTMKELPNYFYPFGNNIIKYIFLLFGIVSLIILIIKDNKNKVYYIMMALISIIPIIRYFVLSSHSNYHNFFAYRAFLPLIMVCMLYIFIILKKLLKRKV